MGSEDLEQAIQRLRDNAGAITLDQRLRLAAVLAQPPEAPPTAHESIPQAAVPVDAMVLTVDETAGVLKVGRTTVYDLIKTGGLNSIMIGRLRRVRYNDIVAYLDHVAQRDTGDHRRG